MGLEGRQVVVREDIEVLRGLAIGLVVLFHAAPSAAPAGYLGVDVFFVISGYLLADRVIAARAREDFSYRTMLWRRFVRLAVPAAPVYVVVAIAGLVLLTAEEKAALWAQLAGAITFTSDVVLWSQGGYFDQDAATKPLLHTWALSTVFQAAVFLTLIVDAWSQWRMTILAVAIVGFVAFALLAQHAPDAAYFLAPFRLWELAVGALAAGVSSPGAAPAARRWAMPGVVGAVADVACTAGPGLQPEATLFACIAVAMALVMRAETSRVWRPLAGLGAISYPLYLIHWPALAFARSLYLGVDPPVVVVAAIILGSIVLAYALHRVVEVRRPIQARHGMAVAVVTALLAGGVPGSAESSPVTDWREERRPNTGLGPQCEFDGPFEPRSDCMTAPAPQILVWGDSVAMQWVEGFVRADTGRLGIAQATMSTCGPMLGISPVYSGALGEQWARRCLAFNDTVLSWLQNEPGIRHVVLSSIFAYNVERGQLLLTHQGRAPQTVDAAYAALMKTVNAIRAAGKSVSVVGPAPVADFDVGACLERVASGLPIAGRRTCDIDQRSHERSAAAVLELLRRVESAGVRVVRPSSALCDGRICHTSLDGQPLYRDKAHISYRGSAVLAARLRILEIVVSK